MAEGLAWLAGETSGDFIASLVLPQVKALYPNEPMFGIGGDRMIAAGLEPWHHSRALSVRGYVEVIKKLPSWKQHSILKGQTTLPHFLCWTLQKLSRKFKRKPVVRYMEYWVSRSSWKINGLLISKS